MKAEPYMKSSDYFEEAKAEAAHKKDFKVTAAWTIIHGSSYCAVKACAPGYLKGENYGNDSNKK